MKKFFFLFPFFLLTTSFTSDPCDIECLQIKGQAALNDFTFIKQFPVEISQDESSFEISYVLSVNSTYRIVIADNEIKGKRMIVRLLDRNKKLISTNILSNTRQFAANIDFVCPVTGVYYIQASVERNNTGNGLVILGYKKETGVSSSPGLQ
jgi:hypothetical protein